MCSGPAATEAEQEVPFGGLLQLLRPALAELDRIPPPQRRALAAALALSEDAAGDRFAVGAATLSLICRYAESSPVALVADDVHLLDRPSAEALLFAARRLVADPVVLLATARTGEPHPLAGADLPELPLRGVDLAAAQDLVGAHSDRAVPTDLVARLHQTVAGNPLALLELAGDLDRLAQLPPDAPVPVPAVLADAFTERTGRLGPDARTALLVAAAEGGDLPIIAAACAVLEVDVAALADAEQAGLVRITGDRVDFRHPLIRSAVYTRSNPADLRAAHQAVGAALAAGRSAFSDAQAQARGDRRAWHLSGAALGPDELVAGALDQAGGHAADRGAPAVAAAAYERAARLTPDTGPRAPRLVAAGTAAWQAGLPDRAEVLLAEALALDPPLPVRVRADAVRADIAFRCGSPARARELFVAAAADADPDTAVSLLAEAVYACFALADAPSAAGVAASIERLLPDTTDPAVRILGWLARGVADVLAGAGGADQLRHAVRQLVAGPEHHADPRLLVWMVTGPLFLRESGTGRALIGQAMRQTRDSAAVGMLPALLFHLARDDATTERWANAETAYDEAIRLSRESGQTTQLGMSLAGLAWLHAHQGRDQDCRRRAAEAIRLGTEHDLRLAHCWALFALGDLELSRGAAADALVHYERLQQLLDEAGVLDPDLSPAPELVDVLLRLGRRQDATHLAEAYGKAAAAKGQPWSLARAARATGLAGSDDTLDEHFGAALAAHERTLDVFETARSRLAYGARLRRARRRVDAREQLRAAVSAFDDLGAAGWADVADTELKATGETARRREPSTAADLTAQERQIALLLSDGLSTREAAAALFLSPKTVEYHLRKVYTKLGIHSRAELADLL